MHRAFQTLPLFPFVCLVAHAEESAPALRYHAALRKSPHNATLAERFHDAWIDEQPLDSLTAFLRARAKSGDGADLTILAHHLLRRGLADEALETLGRAIVSRPDDAQLPLSRAKILISRLDFPAARKDLEAAAESRDAALAVEAGMLTGKTHLREGKPAEAEAAWEKLIAKHPGNTEILEDLVELTSSSDQPERAITYCRRLIGATADPFRKTRHQLRLGELLADSGKPEEALSVWTETLSQTGEGSWLEREVIARITTAFRRLDRIDALSEKLAGLAAANPRRLLIHRELAKLEAAEGKTDSAIGRFREVLRRSPGDAELRGEFIRLLIDSQRFGDAAAELQRMISLSPENPDPHLRLADLAHRRAEADPDRGNDAQPPAEIAGELEKALALMPPGEGSGIRIAGLMLTYGLNARGEELLRTLASAPEASTAPAEALAAQYARTDRKKQARELLTEVAKSPDIDTVLRAASSIASLGDPAAPFDILSARLADFPNQPAYLSALAQASLAAQKPAGGIAPALRLVRLSTLPQEIIDATRTATSVIAAAEKTEAEIASLSASESRTPSETCLLASLLEAKGDTLAADALFENTADPALLRFRVSLLSRRGDPHAAIAALKRLSGDSAAKPDFLKELAELQLRAGLTDASLATLDEWKTAVPTAREPWVISARLLRENGRNAEAISTTRRALTRFPGDGEFSASLADLHQISGDYTEAERLFWKLYDKAPDPPAQSRWAARLSMLAQRTGATAELAEKFAARARSNPRSTGPVLALVELARAAGDRKAIRDNLARALFIKPGDIDIRIQLAEAEAANGNRDGQIEVLREGLAKDPAGRLRTALAQAYISGGEITKGMRMLRALAGERASDPRDAENAAASLHAQGHVPEAIEYLRESLPGGGDWRTKYLLSLMLREDGREVEAIPVLLPLLSEETEITNLPQNNAYRHQFGTYNPYGAQSTDLAALSQLSQAARTASQVISRRQGSVSQHLPVAVAQLRANVLIQLASIASSGNAPAAEAIRAADPPGLGFAIDLIASQQDGNPDFMALLEKHPQQPGLIEMAWQNGLFHQGIEKRIPLLKRVMAAPGCNPGMRFQIIATLIRLEPDEPEHWDKLLALSADAVRSDDAAQKEGVIRQLLPFLTNDGAATPERMGPIREILLDYAGTPAQSPGYNPLRLSIFAQAGTPEQWIAEANAAIAAHRAAPPSGQTGIRYSHSLRSQYAGRVHINPGYPVAYCQSLPAGLTGQIIPAKAESSPANPVTAADLLTQLDKLDSPLLRAYVAVISGDEGAIRKTLDAPHPDEEATDFEILRATREISAGRPEGACRIYAKLRENAGTNTHLAQVADSSLVSLASKLTPEQRAEFEQPLRAALTALIPPPGPYRDVSNIIRMATDFGFTDIVESLSPAPPAANPAPPRPSPARLGPPASITPPSPRRTQQKSSSPIDRFREFARAEKNDAAAREFLRWAGDMKRSGNSIDYVAREAEKSMTPAIKAEILALTDPGSSPGITKRRAHIDICLALGERGKALAALSALAEERPFDPSITIDLAFLLPPSESERASALLARAAGAPQMSESINTAYNRARQSALKPEVTAFFGLIAAYLEDPASAKSPPNDLSRMTSLARDFFTGRITKDMQPLLKSERTNDKQPAADPADIALGRRLALAMLRHPAIAETGFSLLKSAVWEEKTADLDEWARSAVLLTASLGNNGRYHSSSNPFPEKSPIRHILARLAASSPDILPAAFLDALGKQDPHLPALLRFHSATATRETIAALWDSGAMAHSQTPAARILQDAAYRHAAAAPGASGFFLTRIRELREKDAETQPPADPFGQGRPALIQLLRAALETCTSLDETGVQKTCGAIAGFLLPKGQQDTDGQREYLSNNTLSETLGGFTPDPRTAALVVRAFDASSTPIPAHWFRNCIRPLQNMEPAQAVETFDSMGLLADAASWKPLASTDSRYEHTHGKFKFTRSRIDQFGNISERLSTSGRNEISALLDNRKPRTFGSLITAAYLATGRERERLAAAAFGLAAPELRKADARRLDDFVLCIPLLPHSATAGLPPKLRDLALANRAEKAKHLADAAKQQIAQALQNSQNPLGSISGNIARLAPFDLPQSVAIFREAVETYLASASRFANQGNRPDDALDSILRDFASTENPDPETALRFYQAVLASPIGPNFGISRNNSANPFLSVIGQSFSASAASSGNLRSQDLPALWASAGEVPEELRNDAIAAVTCAAVQRGIFLGAEEAGKLFAQIKDPALREIAAAANTLGGWKRSGSDNGASAPGAFVALLSRPEFSPNARTQIALSAVSRHSEIFLDPAVAEAASAILAAHFARDASAVSYSTLSVLTRISAQPIPEAAVPHLRKINDAFWKNANSPVTGGHPGIPEGSTAPLFRTALAVGDLASAKRLFPLVKPSITGRLADIITMLENGQFDFAAALLPDESSTFNDSSIRRKYTPEFDAKIKAFREHTENPVGLLRLETALLEMDPPDRETPKSEFSAERRKRLALSYAASPPRIERVKIEILSSLATMTLPTDRTLADEISAAAAAMDARKIIRGKTMPSQDQETARHASRQWDILCKSAMNSMADGDPAPAASLCGALAAQAGEHGAKGTVRPLGEMHRRFLQYAIPATCQAIASGDTGAFEGILPPLADLAVSLYAAEGFDPNGSRDTLCLRDLIATWEGRPGLIPETLSKIPDMPQSHRDLFPFPRAKPVLLEMLSSTRYWGEDRKPFALSSKGFLVALLSRPHAADLLLAGSSSPFNGFNSQIQSEVVTSFVRGERDGYSPGGRAIVAHAAARSIGNPDTAGMRIDLLRTCLANIPEPKPWDYLRGVSKCMLISELVRTNKYDEARALYDSILPKEIPPNYKASYERLHSGFPENND